MNMSKLEKIVLLISGVFLFILGIDILVDAKLWIDFFKGVVISFIGFKLAIMKD